VNTWGASTYGDPCRECGFDWATPLDDAVLLVARLPVSFGRLLAGASGDERRPDLAWSVGAYVSHVADNLRIWAERLVGGIDGGPLEVAGYDENELASARRYDTIPLQAAQWSLGRSVEDWLHAVKNSSRSSGIIVHPARGTLSLADVVLSNAHDALHHLRDIETTLAGVTR
jgi:hypothetical protein